MRDRLQQDLRGAMLRRDREQTALLRSLLAAIANAEAVEVTTAEPGASLVGVGSTDVARRVLTDTDVRSILTAELDERLRAAATLDVLGRADRAAQLRAEADIVRRYTQ